MLLLLAPVAVGALAVAPPAGRQPTAGDAVFVYATYLGRLSIATAVAVDAAGNAYLTGTTTSTEFPVTAGALQRSYAGGRSAEAGDAFVTKLNPTGAAAVYSTYLGGSSGDRATAIAVSRTGEVYLAGVTYSEDFPGAGVPGSGPRGTNAFVAQVNSSGTGLVYSRYLGGSGEDYIFGMTVDSQGNAYVVGMTSSADFPTTPGAFQTTLGGGGVDFFVTKLDPKGAVVYSTYLGGNRTEETPAIAVDTSGNAYVTGVTNSTNYPTTPGAYQRAFGGGEENSHGDAVVTKLNASGTGLVYSTYLGGREVDFGTGIAVDSAGQAFVAGFTRGGFPMVRPAAADAAGCARQLPGTGGGWVAKLNPSGTGLLYSRLLDPAEQDSEGPAITLDASGRAYVTGFMTESLAVRLSAEGAIEACSGYIGADARGRGIALDAAGGVYVGGVAGSWDFPTTPGAFQTSMEGTSRAFAAKLALTATPAVPPAISARGVVNAASYGDPAFAPGEMVTIFGTGFGPPDLQTLRLDENGRVATELAQTRVLFGGLPAPLVYVAKNQLSAVIPYGAERFLLWGGPGSRTGTIQIRIEYQGRRSAVAGLWLNESAPGIFTADSSGKGQGAILNQDWGRNSPENPAARGSVVMIYGTGEGQTAPPGVDGAIAGATLPKPTLPVSARIGGVEAEVQYAGAAPGLMAGVFQVNLKVPESVAPGPAVPLQIRVGQNSSPTGVTLAVR